MKFNLKALLVAVLVLAGCSGDVVNIPKYDDTELRTRIGLLETLTALHTTLIQQNADAIAQETADRQADVSSLQSSLATLQSMLSAEEAARIAGDLDNAAALQSAINQFMAQDAMLAGLIVAQAISSAVNDAILNAKIQAEKAARIAGDNALAGQLAAEIAARILGDQQNAAALANAIAAQSAINALFAVKLFQLSFKISQLESAVSALQAAVSSQAGDIATLQAQVASLQSEVDALQSDVSALQAQANDLQSQIDDLEEELANLPPTPPTPTASCSVTQYASYSGEKQYSFSVTDLSSYNSYELEVTFTNPNRVKGNEFGDTNGGDEDWDSPTWTIEPQNSQSSFNFYMKYNNGSGPSPTVSSAVVKKGSQTVTCSVSN